MINFIHSQKKKKKRATVRDTGSTMEKTLINLCIIVFVISLIMIFECSDSSEGTYCFEEEVTVTEVQLRRKA